MTGMCRYLGALIAALFGFALVVAIDEGFAQSGPQVAEIGQPEVAPTPPLVPDEPPPTPPTTPPPTPVPTIPDEPRDCAGTINGSAVIDQCGVCEGDNTTCMDCAGVINGDATVDDCGVCEGDNSTCLDCFGVPNGGAEMLECGCDDDYSCKACKYYAATINESWVSNWTKVNDAGAIFAGSGSSLSCLSDILRQCGSNGRVTGEFNFTDDCVGEVFYNKVQPKFSWKAGQGKPGRYISARCKQQSLEWIRQGLSAGLRCSSLSSCSNPVLPSGPREEPELTCTEQTSFIMDENCNVVDEPATNLCGDLDINFLVSPISLLWEGQTRLAGQPAIVEFELQPGQAGWYTWHASASAPLLVFDPAGTGTVAGAEQLFGDYTFGGRKQRGFLPVGLNSDSHAAAKWKNGYEPLAQLDRNGDKKLDGAELKALSLWFDRNRDGKVDTGEIETLEAAGVTALFVEPDMFDDRGHLYALRGFERNVDGKLVKGASVDWYGAFYSNKLQAISDTEQKYPAAERENEGPAQGSEPLSEAAASNLGINLSGAWMWRVTDDMDTGSGPLPTGLLTFKESNGMISGHSYVEVPIQENADRRRSFIKVSVLDGYVNKFPNGEVRVVFEAVTNGAQSTRNVGVLNSAGTQLRGTSTTVIGGREVSYEWVAERESRS